MFDIQINNIFTISNFRIAFDEISSNAIGIDNISYQEFKEDFSNQIKNLIDSILIENYSPEPLKRIEIKKKMVLKKDQLH